MKRIVLLGILAVLLGMVTQAEAVPLQWTLQGATFDDQTSASGSFFYDANTNTYSNWSISVQGGTLSAFTYDTTSSQLNLANQDSTGVMFIENGFTRYINFNFVGSLTNAGGTVLLDLTPFFVNFNVSSWECNNCLPVVRVFTGGSVTATAAVPEPGALLLLGSGLVGLAAWRRKR